MLDGIGPLLSNNQATDLLKRLENRDVRTALAAEVELGLLWAIGKVTETQLHPELSGTKRRPEAFCLKLFPSAPAYIEVTAVSDDTFSDRDKMERAANIISQFANSVRKGSGEHLRFRFKENRGYENGKYRRYRCIKSAFKLTPAIEDILRNWLIKPDWPNPQSIRLTDDTIDVEVQWSDHVHRAGRAFSSMPSIAYDVEDNPVYKRLKEKQSQLSGAPPGSLKCIFLVDVGCDTLRVLHRSDSTRRIATGEQIIWHFLNKYSVDIVVVFSAQSNNIYSPVGASRIWRVTYFDKRTSVPTEEHDGLRKIAAVLPTPNYEGYTARSLHRQGSFTPQGRGQYLGSHAISGGGRMSMEMKLSARLVLEFLAGRITAEQFHDFSGTSHVFETMLKAGKTLQNARIEKTGLDKDDDYLVFDLDLDYAALPLKRP